MTKSKVIKVAKFLANFGFDLIPLIGKAPFEGGWQKRKRYSLQDLFKKCLGGKNIGVRSGRELNDKTYLAMIDCDVKSSESRHLAEMLDAVERHFPGLINTAPFTLSGRGNGSRHLWTRTKKSARSKKLSTSEDMVPVLLKNPDEPKENDEKHLSTEQLKAGYRMRPAWEIEIIGLGKQCVIPGSIHPDTGKPYTWGRRFTALPELPMIDAEEVKPEKNKSKSGKESATTEVDLPFELPDTVDLAMVTGLPTKAVAILEKGENENGNTNQSDIAFEFCLAAFQSDLSDAEITSLLTDHPRFKLAEVGYKRRGQSRQRAAEWVYQYCVKAAREKSDLSSEFDPIAAAPENGDIVPNDESWKNLKPLPLRRDLPPPAPFPTDALGEHLAPAAKRLHEVVQAPDSICAQSILAAATLAAQAHGDIRIDGRTHPFSENFINVGETGERKSGVDRYALSAVRDFQKALMGEYELAFQKFNDENAVYTAKREDILRIAKKKTMSKEEAIAELEALGPAPVAPLKPIILIEEPTYEGLVKQLGQGRPSIGLFSDEGGRLIGGHAMNPDNQLKTITGLCQLWDGKEIDRVRSGDGASLMYGKRASMHLMIQPIIALPLFANPVLSGQGWLSRCLCSYPESTMGSRPYNEVDLSTDPIMKAYNKKLNSLLKLKLPLKDGSRNELTPRPLNLSESAKKKWTQFHDEVERGLKEGGLYREISALANKIPEHALRLAGTLTLIRNANATEVKCQEVESAIELVRFYLNESLRLRRFSSGSRAVQLAEKLLAWLHKHGEQFVPIQDIYQKGPPEMREARQARKIMIVLAEHNWVRRATDQDGEVWEIRSKDC